MKFWVTKYALTQGIIEVEAEEPPEKSPDMLVVRPGADSEMFSFSFTQYLHGSEWHRTREDAVKEAESMRVKKIASLEKSILKIKKLKF